MSPLVDASSKMKVLLLLVTAGFTICEKLDRTYLPPPGSKFSGGSPGDIQTPLEFPKEFPSRLTQTENNGLPTLDDPRIELGINRGLETATVSETPFPATYFPSSPRVPSTTTSYAFSQTTTFPVDSYETTTAAVTSNFPTTGPLNYYREHVGSKLPHPTTNPEYHQVFGQSLNRSQIAQPIFGTNDNPIYGAKLVTKNNPFYSGLNVQEDNQQQIIPTDPGTKPFSSNTFELFKNSYNSGNIHDTSKISYPSNSYLPAKQNNQVNIVEKQYQQQHYRRPISRYPAAQISQSDEQRKEAANLSEKPNTVFPILTSEFSEQSAITPSNYVTNFSSTPSEAYSTSIYQELPHQTFLPGIRKIDSSNLPDVYNDSSSGAGFPKTQAKENLNQLNSNENNFPTTEISQKPLSYDYTQRTVNKFSHPEYYSTTAAPISPVQFTGNYPSATLNNQIPSIYPSELVPGSVNKPFIYKTKSTPSPFEPPIVSTYPSNKGILTSASVFGPTNVAFENRPTDVSIGTQSPTRLLHTTNQAYSTSSAPDVTNVPSNIGDYSRESQSFFVPTADNTQYPLKSLIQPSYSTAHTDHSDSPQRESDRNAVILSYENVITPDGFKYSYDTSNGIHAEETGTAINGVKTTGSFSYTGDDGKVYSITYSADENGFRPTGDHLPTPPPIPEAILRMLEQNAKDEEAGIFDDGSYNADKIGHHKYQEAQDYDLLQPVYRRPSTNIPQSNKNTINTKNSDTVILTKPREENTEEDENERGVPINFVPSKYTHNKNEPIKNVTIVRKIGKPTTVEENYSDIIGHQEIELDSKYPSSELNKYLSTPSNIIKDDTKSFVTNQRIEQQKSIDKKPENLKNIPDTTKELDLTNGNQYVGTYENNGFNPTKGEPKNTYKTNYEQRNEGPTVNYNKDIVKFTTNRPNQEIITNKPLERGYEYKPPQNNYFPAPNAFQMRSSVGEVISTTQPFNSRKETAITENKRKPFMTPNVYGEDVNDKDYSSGSPYKNKPKSPEYLENEDYDNRSQVTDSETLTSTSRRPEYRTTSVPTTNFETFTPRQKGYNSYVENKNTHSTTQEPAEDSSSTTLTPLRGSVKFESASSPKDTDVSQLSYYPATVEPLKGSRITGYPSTTDSTIFGNSFDSAPQKLTHDNVPSTTFRPNYTIFQENRPGGLNVDAYGRPVETESYGEGPINPRPKHGKNFQTESLLGKGSVDDKDFYPSDKADNNEQIKQEGLNVGKGVKAPSYPSSFVKVKGENFSGPSRNQKFDPKIGYYYK